MTRSWLVVVVAALACGKEEKPADPKAVEPVQQKPAEKPAEPKPAEKPAEPAKPPAKLKAAPNSADIGLVPVDSELVLGVDFAALSVSTVWKQMIEPRVMTDSVKAKLAEIKTKCGYDPLGQVKSATVGMKLGKPDEKKPRDGVVIVHGLDKTKATACFDKMKGQAKDKAEITQDGDTTIVKLKTGDAFAVQFTGADTALVVIGPNATAAGVKTVAAGGSALPTSAAFVDLFNKLDTQSTVWMVMNTAAMPIPQFDALGLKPKAMFGTLGVGTDVVLAFRVRLDSPDQATQMAQMGKGQASAAKSMLSFDKFDFNHDGADLLIEASISNAKLPQLVKQMQAIAAMQAGQNKAP